MPNSKIVNKTPNGASAIRVQTANNLGKSSIPKLITAAQLMHDQMDANAVTFPAPPVIMADLQTAIDNVSTAYQVWSVKGAHGSHADKLAMSAARLLLLTATAQEEAYVLSVARTVSTSDILAQSAIVLSAGMRVKNNRSKQSLPGQVTNIRQIAKKTLQGTGKAYLRWKRPLISPKGNTSKMDGYNIFVTDGTPGNADLVATTTKTTYIATPTDFNPSGGTLYFVAAFNAAGDGANSNLVLLNGQ